MNRIETKIIIMVTNRLAAAADSDAKTEMIEELSENLYQRYLELVAGGVPEEDALRQAMESLGDVDELLAYLREAELEAQAQQAGGAKNAAEAVTKEAAAEEAAAGERTARDIAEEETQEEEENTESTGSFFRDDLESGIEEIVNAALSTARVAVDCARDVARDVSEQIKEKYPEGVFTPFSPQKGKKVDCTAIPSEGIHSLEVQLTNGDIYICYAEDADAFLEVSGDTEGIETMLKEDGVVSIGQGGTASAAFFFMRGMRKTDIMVKLPRRVWNSISLSTVNGDISMPDGGLECGKLSVSTTSGDLQVKEVSGDEMIFKSGSGDIYGEALCGRLHAETKSGDIRVSGSLERCELFSASGDVKFEGESTELNSSSTSGDVGADLDNVPGRAKLNSISGDCEIRVPAESGFRLSYRTVSGSFSTNLSLTGMREAKRGEAVFGDGERGTIQLSSVSGDVSIYGKEMM